MRISKLAKLELDDAKEDLEEARKALDNSDDAPTNGSASKADEEDDDSDDDNENADEDEGKIADDDDDLKEYDMDNYDNEPDIVHGGGDDDDDDDEPSNSIFGNIKSLAYHTDNKDDPYITLPENEDEDDEEREELQVLPTDNMVLSARIEDEVAHLEVYVYEDDADNLYVHHDCLLPSIPLCVEWVGTKVGAEAATATGGNFAAVGTMEPEIELWDLDVVDSMYPNTILGQSNVPDMAETLSKKKKKKSKKANPAFHVDAVLALAANRAHRNLLASASADKTTKLWDLTTCTAAHSYAHHTDKVCALAWHPTQTSVLLSGSYDRTIVAADMRAPQQATVPRWGVESDVELLRWDPHDDHRFYASTENGILHCFDARTIPSKPEASRPVWRLQAHEKSLSALAVNPVVPGFIATGSTDRSVKLWSVPDNAGTEGIGGPSLVASRDLGVGKVFAAHFAPDDAVAFRLAVGGSKGAVQVWDTSTNKAVREAFATRVKLPAARAGDAEGKERLVGVLEDNELEDEEAEDEENGGEGGWESMDEE